MKPSDSLDDQLKAADVDRWLATRFMTDQAARLEVVALYLIDHELSLVASRANTPLMGEIRFAWWREAIGEAARTGVARSHPALSVVAPAFMQGRLSADGLYGAIEARHAELDGPWFPDEPALDAYLDAIAVSMSAMVARRLDPTSLDRLVAPGARLALLSRLVGQFSSSVPSPWWPQTWLDVHQRDAERHLTSKLASEQRRARSVDQLSPEAFPAIAHAALCRNPQDGPLTKRMRITSAVLHGRV